MTDSLIGGARREAGRGTPQFPAEQ